MLKLRWAARVAAVVLGLACAPGAAAQPPVQAFAELPFIAQPSLSPDGRYLAVIRAHKGRPIVAVYDLASPNSAPTAIPSQEWVINGLAWAKNDRLLIFIHRGRRAIDGQLRTWFRVASVRPDGSGMAYLLDGKEYMRYQTGTGVTNLAPHDPRHIYMPYSSITRAGMYRSELQLVDVTTGRGTRVAISGEDTLDWYLTRTGGLVARLDQSTSPLKETVKVPAEGGRWRTLAEYPADADRGAGIRGLTADDAGLARLAGDDRSRVLTRVDLASGRETLLFRHPQYDVSSAIQDEWTGQVIGAVYYGDKAEYVFFDPALQRLQRGIEEAFPGLSATAVSYSLDRKKAVISVNGPRHPPTYYLLDRTTHEAKDIATTYAGLSEKDLGEMKPYAYKARDGLTIPAYITLPPGKTAKNLPAVVMPHGGPDSRDAMRFDWWAQFLANRGYVVLQPNFRGSSGYGRAFTQAGLQQWGLKMQDDISDGVARMIADGIANPKRICIVGASYGGYAALAGATLTPDLYACAVSIAGVSDLPEMIARERQRFGRESGTVSFWISRIGSPSDDSERLRATSPARLAARVKAPVLLLHGENDTTVPIHQSKLMRDALESAGKDVTFVRLEGDDHYLMLGPTRLTMLTEIERFLTRHIGR